MLSLCGEETVSWLRSIFDTIWATESVPEDWQSQLLVPLHKKGSWTICNNYWGWDILSISGKVFAKAILHWLKPIAELLLGESQCGFKQGKGCVTQLFSLRIIMKKGREYHQPIYICFIDLRRAYDSVQHDSLCAFFSNPTSYQRSCWSSSEFCMRTTLQRSGLMGRHLRSSYSCAVFVRAVCWPPIFSLYTLMWPSAWLWMHLYRESDFACHSLVCSYCKYCQSL